MATLCYYFNATRVYTVATNANTYRSRYCHYYPHMHHQVMRTTTVARMLTVETRHNEVIATERGENVYKPATIWRCSQSAWRIYEQKLYNVITK